MTPYKLLLSIIVVTSLLIWACTKEEDNINSNKHLYFPQTIQITDSVNSNIRTAYQYDRENRIIAIFDTINYTEDSERLQNTTLSTIEYDGQNNITKMVSSEKETSIEEITTQYTTIYNFSYSTNAEEETTVLMGITNQETAFTQNYQILLNGKHQAIKITPEGLDRSVSFEYDRDGKLSKTVNEDGIEFYFGFDSKRGIFREVNMPHWVIQIVLGIPRNAQWVDMGQYMNIAYNCEKIEIIDTADATSDDRVSFRNYTNIYNPFGYPVEISDNYKFEIAISYGRNAAN